MKLLVAALALSSSLFAPVYSDEQDDCDGRDPELVTFINIFDSEVVTNTLQDPNGEIRYQNIGMFENQELDLVVTITDGDYASVVSAEWPVDDLNEVQVLNGKENDEGKFGRINLQTVKSDADSGEGNFRFCIMKTGTNTPVPIGEFSFTAYDADERGDDNLKAGIGIKEKLLINTSQIEYLHLSKTTEITIECEDGSPYNPEQDCIGRTVFLSSEAGTGDDNPKDPNDLSQIQQDRSIMFTFKDTACWEFTYDHYCPAEQDGYLGGETECRWYGGGNFLFSGESDVMNKCTSPPTTKPSTAPTGAPSPAPTQYPTPYPTTTPPTTPEPSTAPTGATSTAPTSASSSGDPHFKTWTGDKYDYHGECDLVLVDHPTFSNGLGLKIHIRTTRVKYFSYISNIAVQIGDEVLEFDNDVENFLINGEKVPPQLKHVRTLLGGFHVRRDPKAISIRLDDHIKAKIDLVQRKNGWPAVVVDGEETEIFKGSLGLLGDWETGKRLARDGNTEMNDSDATNFALEWQVRDTEPMLFKEARFPQYPRTCTPPTKNLSKRLGVSNFEKEAQKACAHWKEDVEDCIFDVIATRDVKVAEEGHIGASVA